MQIRRWKDCLIYALRFHMHERWHFYMEAHNVQWTHVQWTHIKSLRRACAWIDIFDISYKPIDSHHILSCKQVNIHISIITPKKYVYIMRTLRNIYTISLCVKRERVRVTSHLGARFRYTSRSRTLLGFASRRDVNPVKQGQWHHQMSRQQTIKRTSKQRWTHTAWWYFGTG